MTRAKDREIEMLRRQLEAQRARAEQAFRQYGDMLAELVDYKLRCERAAAELAGKVPS